MSIVELSAPGCLFVFSRNVRRRTEMSASAVADVKDLDGFSVDRKQCAVAMLPSAVEQLADILNEGVTLRGRWAALGEIAERAQSVHEAVVPAMGTPWRRRRDPPVGLLDLSVRFRGKLNAVCHTFDESVDRSARAGCLSPA